MEGTRGTRWIRGHGQLGELCGHQDGRSKSGKRLSHTGHPRGLDLLEPSEQSREGKQATRLPGGGAGRGGAWVPAV